ncbi:uncharacterized protein LOC129942170 [Eupeodes corollae]|uniref:uncharacterized protein LOC129942170 n=1 Tax=Eupeodes corollae TaxID=290404 RepID=UPI002490D51C|nr:uncharacterized protein LOC129942170 [Eupeodes corollae]
MKDTTFGDEEQTHPRKEILTKKMLRTRLTDGPPPFDFKADGNCGGECRKWLRSFEIFAQENSMENGTKKLNWMLHYGGEKVQTVYYSLPEVKTTNERRGPLASGYVFEQKDEYEQAVVRLCAFFEPKQSISYERHIFRQRVKESICSQCACGNKLSAAIFVNSLMKTFVIRSPVGTNVQCIATTTTNITSPTSQANAAPEEDPLDIQTSARIARKRNVPPHLQGYDLSMEK